MLHWAQWGWAEAADPGWDVPPARDWPPTPIETEGAVIWVREHTNEDGPSGMGIAFLQLIDYGIRGNGGTGMPVRGSFPWAGTAAT